MANKSFFIAELSRELKEALHGKGNLTPEDDAYVTEQLDNITDQRLKECVGQLLGWDEEQRARIETAMSVFIELLKMSPAKRIIAAAQKAEVKFHLRHIDDGT